MKCTLRVISSTLTEVKVLQTELVIRGGGHDTGGWGGYRQDQGVQPSGETPKTSRILVGSL